LMVYSGTTLGLIGCGIELVSVEGTAPGRKQRRWRFAASLLSAASMMLGYAWVLLDDQQLCWHDRITHTYLRVRERRSL
jgi:RDD family